MSKGLRRGMIAALAAVGMPNCDIVYCFVIFAAGTGGRHLPTWCQPLWSLGPSQNVTKPGSPSQEPTAKGQFHNDSEFRRFLPNYSHLEMGNYEDGWAIPFREAWHLLQRRTET